MTNAHYSEDQGAADAACQIFETTDLEEATFHMSSQFSPHKADGNRHLRRISFRHRFCQLRSISVSLVEYGCNDNDVVIRTPHMGEYDMFILPISGVSRMSAGGPLQAVGQGAVAFMRRGEPFFQKPGKDYRCYAIKVPTSLTHDYGFAHLAQVENQVCLNKAVQSGNTQCALHLAQSALSLNPSASNGRSNAMLKDTLETSIMHALLDLYQIPGEDSLSSKRTPYFVSQGIDFIEENYKSRIFVDDIADAAHVGVRTLQLAFSRHVGLSPMQYLRQVRLDASRRSLLHDKSSAPASVTDVALTNGFEHLSRFSSAYSKRFGEFPSETLKKW